MEHVVSIPHPPFTTADGQLTVHQLPAWKDNFVWVIACNRTGVAAVIDGPNADAALACCNANGLSLQVILNTHTHGDHIGINRDLEKRGLLSSLKVYGRERTKGSVPGLTHPVNDGDTVTVGEVSGKVLLTEGHLDGHISFVFDDVLFCGDTLFGGGCGYLFDGPPRTMKQSLDRLAALPPETRVCCAHEYTQDNLRFAWSVEPENTALADRIKKTWARRLEGHASVPSTIALERETNPFLRHESPDLRQHVRQAIAPDADTADAWFAATRRLKDTKQYKTITDSELPLSGDTSV